MSWHHRRRRSRSVMMTLLARQDLVPSPLNEYVRTCRVYILWRNRRLACVEVFATNSFEQLMINWSNERLQAQFNRFIFEVR